MLGTAWDPNMYKYFEGKLSYSAFASKVNAEGTQAGNWPPAYSLAASVVAAPEGVTAPSAPPRRRSRSRNRAARAMLLPVTIVRRSRRLPDRHRHLVGSTNERVGGVFGIVKTRFIGLTNFRSIIDDPLFRGGAVLILEIGGAVVGITYVLAYLQASLLNTDFPFRRVVRTIAFGLPMAVPAVVVGTLFGYLYDPSVGSVDGWLVHLGLVKTPQFLPDRLFAGCGSPSRLSGWPCRSPRCSCSPPCRV